jgi:hypothetical protein
MDGAKSLRHHSRRLAFRRRWSATTTTRKDINPERGHESQFTRRRGCVSDRLKHAVPAVSQPLLPDSKYETPTLLIF